MDFSAETLLINLPNLYILTEIPKLTFTKTNQTMKLLLFQAVIQNLPTVHCHLVINQEMIAPYLENRVQRKGIPITKSRTAESPS